MKHLILHLMLAALATVASAQSPLLVKDINPTNAALDPGSAPSDFCVFNGKLYFAAGPNIANTANRELWVTDGTASGTHLVVDLNISGSSNPKKLMVYNNQLVFIAGPLNEREIYISDGTASGTGLLRDAHMALNGDPTDLTVFNGNLYYSYWDFCTGANQVWKSDGTYSGTDSLCQVGWHNTTRYPAEMTVCNGKMYFTDGNDTTGTELWVTDGNRGAGTHIFMDFAPGATSSNPQSLFAFNNKLYFVARESIDSAQYLWQTDGTVQGTHKFLSTPSSYLNYKVMNNQLYIGGWGLWVTDGTTAGTQELIAPNSSSASVLQKIWNNKLYFLHSESATGSELFVTDGTVSGTHIVKDICAGGCYGYPGGGGLAESGNKLYFVGDPTGNSNALSIYSTDGTTAGTAKLAGNTDLTGFSSFGEYNGSIYFAARYDYSLGSELYTLSAATGLETVSGEESSIHVYPNPASTQLFIQTNGASIEQVNIYNTNGSLVLAASPSSSICQLYTATLPNGIYFIEVKTAEGMARKKFVKV